MKIVNPTPINISLLSLVLLIFYSSAHASFFSSSEEQTANIGFGENINDEVILSLLEESGAKATAARIWLYGFTSSYRKYDEIVPPLTFLHTARAKLAESLGKTYARTIPLLESYLNEINPNPVTLRSILNRREALKSALAALKNNEPIIYSLEVIGSEANLSNLKNDSRVAVFSGEGVFNISLNYSATEKPEQYKAAYDDPYIQSIPDSELFNFAVNYLADEMNEGTK